MTRDPWTVALDIIDPQPDPYANDPAGWISDILGEHLWSKQIEIADSVSDHRYTAVHACHDVGKSWLVARLAAHWIATHPPGTAFVVSTAPTFTQVRAILWREIGRAHRAGNLPGRLNQTEWHLDGELVGMGRKPADYDPSAFQGIHARYVLVVIDEACGIPEDIWNAADALVTNEDCRIVAIGNPDDPVSHFAKVCKPGSGWNVIHVDGLDSPNFTDEPVPDDLRPMLLSPVWVQERLDRWGEDSALYISKVRGRFPEDATDTVIPLSWVQAAFDRWREWDTAGRPMGPVDQVGIDVSAGGADLTVCAERHGPVITHLHKWSGLRSADTMVSVGRFGAVLGQPGQALGVVDVVGIGKGATDRLRELGHRVIGFNAGAGCPNMVDQTETYGFANRRSAAWWTVRELLDPGGDAILALPPDDDLAAELVAPRWQPTSGGKIAVESKAEIKKRLGRSTDLADAVMQAVWVEPDQEEAIVEHYEPVSISAY